MKLQSVNSLFKVLYLSSNLPLQSLAKTIWYSWSYFSLCVQFLNIFSVYKKKEKHDPFQRGKNYLFIFKWPPLKHSWNIQLPLKITRDRGKKWYAQTKVVNILRTPLFLPVYIKIALCSLQNCCHEKMSSFSALCLTRWCSLEVNSVLPLKGLPFHRISLIQLC